MVSPINGDANVPFYKELGNQGLKATDIPVEAFSERPVGRDAGPPSEAGLTSDAAAPVDAGSQDAGLAACDGSTCGIETVLSNLNQGGTLAVDSVNVYVEDQGTTTGQVYQCPKTGCASPTSLGPGYATGIASDAQYVYWNDFGGGTIVRCAIGGCGGAPSVLATAQASPVGITVDATSVYWVNEGGTGMLQKLPKP